MAKVLLTKTAEEALKEYDPGDQEAVARAISLLEDDRSRETNRVDFFLIEGVLKVWGFFVGNVSLPFVEGSPGEITVIHIALLSRFRYPGVEP